MTRKIVTGYRRFAPVGGELRPLRREREQQAETAIARFLQPPPLDLVQTVVNALMLQALMGYSSKLRGGK